MPDTTTGIDIADLDIADLQLYEIQGDSVIWVTGEAPHKSGDVMVVVWKREGVGPSSVIYHTAVYELGHKTRGWPQGQVAWALRQETADQLTDLAKTLWMAHFA